MLKLYVPIEPSSAFAVILNTLTPVFKSTVPVPETVVVVTSGVAFITTCFVSFGTISVTSYVSKILLNVGSRVYCVAPSTDFTFKSERKVFPLIIL